MINVEAVPRDVITIGASAGGVEAITTLLGDLPADLPAILGIVLHRGRYHKTQLAAILGRRARIPVLEPLDGTSIAPGLAYLAPQDQHLLFENGRIRLSRGPREHHSRPAIDALFRSAAESYGPRVVGVILSGFGSDGVAGLITIKKVGGLSLVQEPAEARHPTMPSNAIADDDVDAVLTLDALASALGCLARGQSVEVTPVHARTSVPSIRGSRRAGRA
jgi:two-component system chemotaxis response regulator CheB